MPRRHSQHHNEVNIMAAISEKILWPLIGVVIFAVLAAFYIDDRRRLVEESATGTSNQQASAQKKPAPTTISKSSSSNSTSSSRSSGSQSTGSTSMSIDEYLGQSTSERSKKLEANAAQHQGFSGSIEEYLSGSKPNATKNIQANTSGKSSESEQANSESSMSMDEYNTKFGDGKQTKLNTSSDKPFNKQEHTGFHGSYEEYAKKFN